MRNQKTVLVTDYAWPNLNQEREILEAVGARLIVPNTGSYDEMIKLAPIADAILCNWKAVSAPIIQAAKRCVTIGRFGVEKAWSKLKNLLRQAQAHTQETLEAAITTLLPQITPTDAQAWFRLRFGELL